MAISAATNWYIRAGGSQTNGGGYDSTISGAGTNYADQDAAQVVFSVANVNTLTTSGANATTVTSAGTPFTSAMVGNCIRISGGTNFTTGYYFITAFTDSANVVLDRTPTPTGAGVAGLGSLGGAFPGFINLANGGGATQPTLTSPLAAGHTINVRGGGTDDPSSTDYSQSSYYQFPSGDTTNGRIKLIGYNGRPNYGGNALILYNMSYWHFEHMKFKATGTNFATNGLSNPAGNCTVYDCYWDQAGFDVHGANNFQQVVNCKFVNSGSTSTGTFEAWVSAQYNGFAFGNTFDGWKFNAIESSVMASIHNNLIVNCKGIGINIDSGQTNYQTVITNNTIYNNSSDGIKITTTNDVANTHIYNNIVVKNGGYGLNYSGAGGSTLYDNLSRTLRDYNNWGTGATANTSGAIHNGSLGTHDVQLDPQFTNTAGNDYSVGTNMKAIGFPSAFPGESTTSYVDLGGAQRQEPTTVSPRPMVIQNIGTY